MLNNIGVTLNPDYWDCNCENNYIHHKSQRACTVCGKKRVNMPDARQNEIDEMLEAFEENELIPKLKDHAGEKLTIANIAVIVKAPRGKVFDAVRELQAAGTVLSIPVNDTHGERWIYIGG